MTIESPQLHEIRQRVAESMGRNPLVQKIMPNVTAKYTDPAFMATDSPRMRFVRDNLTMTSLEGLNVYAPDFLDGRYLRSAYEKNPQVFIPEPHLRQAMLFCGETDFEGLHTRVDRRINQLGSSFNLRDYSYGEQMPDAKQPKKDQMPTDNIFKALAFVKETMREQTRRTGEPAFAHILRVVDRGISLINRVNRRFNSGKETLFFTPESAELFLLVLTLHDFTEDTYGMQLAKLMKFLTQAM